LVDTSSETEIELDDQQRLFTSRSLEDLNTQAEQTWSENPSSPTGSTSSVDTVRPSITESTLSDSSNTLITPIEIAIINR